MPEEEIKYKSAKEPSLSRKITKNTTYNILGYSWGVVVSLVLTPYIISKLGFERFGIWALIAVVVNYFGLADLGIGTSFLKYITEYYTKKDYKKLNQVVNTGFFFYLFWGGVLLLLSWMLKTRILGLFKFSPALYNEATFVFMGVLFITVIRTVFVIYKVVINGLQRMDITNTMGIIISIPNIVGTILFLALGYGLKGLIYNSIIVALLTIFFQVFYAYKLLPELKFNPFLFSKETFKTLFNYGIKVEISRISELINLQVDKLLLGHFIGVSTVAFYELGSKISNTAKSLPEMLLPAITPAASELDALNDKKNLSELYIRGSKYIALTTIPLAFFIFFNASLIMLLWMGKGGYEKSVLTIQYLIIAYSIYLFTGVGRLIARGTGAPQYEMKSSLLIAILNIVLSAILIIKIGFVGALIGTALSSVIGTFYFIKMFHRNISGKNIIYELKKVYIIPIACSIIATLCIWFCTFIFKFSHFLIVGRLGAFIALLINGIIFSGICLFIILKSKYIDEYDKTIIRKTIKIVKT